MRNLCEKNIRLPLNIAFKWIAKIDKIWYLQAYDKFNAGAAIKYIVCQMYLVFFSACTEDKKGLASLLSLCLCGVPRGVRTPVTAVKGRCPRPLDDGDS